MSSKSILSSHVSLLKNKERIDRIDRMDRKELDEFF